MQGRIGLRGLRQITKRSHSAPRRCACGARSLPFREPFRSAPLLRSRGRARGLEYKNCARRAGLRTNCSLRSQLRLRQSLSAIAKRQHFLGAGHPWPADFTVCSKFVIMIKYHLTIWIPCLVLSCYSSLLREGAAWHVSDIVLADFVRKGSLDEARLVGHFGSANPQLINLSLTADWNTLVYREAWPTLGGNPVISVEGNKAVVIPSFSAVPTVNWQPDYLTLTYSSHIVNLCRTQNSLHYVFRKRTSVTPASNPCSLRDVGTTSRFDDHESYSITFTNTGMPSKSIPSGTSDITLHLSGAKYILRNCPEECEPRNN
jgi:hypothetical protein